MAPKSTLAERIQLLIDTSKLTIPKFATAIGAKTPQAVREILKGTTKTLSGNLSEGLFKLFPDLNPLWLHQGEGEMFINKESLVSKEEALLLAANENIVSILDRITELQNELKEAASERRDLVALAKSQQQTIAEQAATISRQAATIEKLAEGSKKVAVEAPGIPAPAAVD